MPFNSNLKRNLKILLISGLLVTAFPALSANTIVFNGEVTDQTCEAVIDGKADPTVVLPSVTVGALQGQVGKVAGETTFTLQLTNCVAPSVDETFTVLFQAPNATPSGNLRNTASGGAEGVALQLLHAPNGDAVSLIGGGPVPVGDIILPAQESSTTYEYAVQYVSEDMAVTTGPVLGAVTYTVRYE